jgi:hypothetical protein
LAVVDAVVMPRSSVVESAEVIKRLAAERGVARSRIVVDDDGVGGGVVDLLPGCVAFKGGSRVVGESNYRNLKAQCSYTLAERVNARLVAWQVDAWQEEVMAELRWIKRDKVDSDGKLIVLGKDKVKEGLGRSPDLADALMMRMVLELRREPVGSDYLRGKGRAHRTSTFAQGLKDTWRI